MSKKPGRQTKAISIGRKQTSIGPIPGGRHVEIGSSPVSVLKLRAVEGDGRRWDKTPKPPAPGVTVNDLATLITLYTADPWIHAAANRIAAAIAGVRRIFYKRAEKKPVPKAEDDLDALAEVGEVDDSGPKWKRSHDTQLQQILDEPNPHQTWEDLVELLVIDLKIIGWSWWEKSLDGEKILGLWRLRPDRVEIDPDEIGYWEGIKFYRTGMKEGGVSIKPDELVGFRYWSPISDYWPVSGLFASQVEVIWEMWARTWNSSVFRNGAAGMPEGVFETDQSLRPQDVDRITERIRSKIGHPDVWRDILVLDKGLKFRATQQKQNDMQFVELMNHSRDAKLAAMGVPPAMVGLPTASGLGGIREQRMLFYQVTILPLLRKIQATINRFLAPKGEKMEFDLQDILSLIEDLESQMRSAESEVTRGLRTINEIREERGLPKVPWGDKWWAPLGLAPIDATDRPERPPGLAQPGTPGAAPADPNAPPGGGPPAPSEDTILADAAREEKLTDYNVRRTMLTSGMKTIRQRMKKKFEIAYRKAFTKVRDDVQSFFRGRAVSKSVEELADILKADKPVPQFDWRGDLEPYENDDFIELVFDIVGPEALDQTNAAAKVAARGLGVNFREISRATPEFEKILGEWRKERIGSTARSISDRMAKTAERVRSEGLSPGRAVDAIMRDFDEFVDQRIADLVTSDATTFSNAAIMAEGGDVYTHKQWVDMGDDHVRNRVGGESHIAKNFPGGDIVPLEKKFRVPGRGQTYEMDQPGDPAGGPEVTSNCRCGLILLTEEEARAQGAA